MNVTAAEPQLATHQLAFVDAVLASQPGTVHVLRAPAGMGKTTTAIALVARLLASDPLGRVLLLSEQLAAARFMAAQFISRFPAIKVQWIASRDFVAREALLKADESVFREPGVYITSLRTALSDRVRLGIEDTTWELALVDTDQCSDPELLRLIQTLARNHETRQVITAREIGGTEELGDSILTDWSHSITTVPTPTEISEHAYSLSSNETRFRSHLAEWAQEISSDPRGAFIAQSLLARARSSPLATERALQDLRRALNSGDEVGWIRTALGLIDTEAAVFSTEVSGLGKDSSESRIEDIFLLPAGSQERLNALISEFGNIFCDSKLGVATEWIKARVHQSSEARLGVFSSFGVTTVYLRTALQENFKRVSAITGKTDPSDVVAFLGEFGKHGDILLATAAGVRGFELPCTDVLHYDVPVNDAEWNARIAAAPRAHHHRLVEAGFESGGSPVRMIEAF